MTVRFLFNSFNYFCVKTLSHISIWIHFGFHGTHCGDGMIKKTHKRWNVRKILLDIVQKVQTSYTFLSTWRPLFSILIKKGFRWNFIYFCHWVYDRLLQTYQACTVNFINAMMNNRFRFKKKISLKQNDSICEKKTFLLCCSRLVRQLWPGQVKNFCRYNV